MRAYRAAARRLSSASRASRSGVYDPRSDEAWEPSPRSAAASARAAMARVPDMRSDTVTVPSASMILAMMDAPVGDDVYGEDPSVNSLQAMAAELLGKEAALFVPTGTMSNLIAIAAQCGRGDEVLLGDEQHLFRYEQGNVSQFCGVALHTLPQAPDGTFALAAGGVRAGAGARAGAASGSLAYALASRGGGGDAHFPRPAVLALENTHNRCGGAVLPQAWVDAACAAAHAAGLAVHMDGARLLNACAASGVAPHVAVRGADTVSLCMSKGLGAPLGSVLAGPRDVIARAHRLRKALGGGMRQAGVAAAAAIVGLREVRPLLAGDHTRAKSLARGLAAVPGLAVDVPAVHTNIVFFDIDARHLALDALRARAAADAGGEAAALLAAAPGLAAARDTGAAFVALLAHFAAGTRIGSYGTHRLRAVTHYQINDADIERAIDGASKAAHALRRE